MKKFFFLLLVINQLAKAQDKVVYINVPRHEFLIITGMTITGVGLSIQPNILRTTTSPYYHYPEVYIPYTIGISLTFTGLIDGLRQERKRKK